MNISRGFLFSLFFATLLSSCLSAAALAPTNHKADSLRAILSTKTGDDKIATQLDIALLIFATKNEEAVQLTQAALKAAKQSGNKALEMRSYFVFGRVVQDFKTLQQSQAYYDTALLISNTLDEYWYKSEILLRQGINQHTMGDIYKSLETYNEAIRAGILSDNYRIVGASYSMMGTIFRVNGMYDRAIEYIIHAKINYEKANYNEGFGWSAYLLGRIYSDLENHDKALENFNEALGIYQELYKNDNNTNGIIICREQIGTLKLKAGNLKEAREHIEYTLEENVKNGSKYGISNAYKILGKIEYVAQNYELAEQYLQKALKDKIDMGDALSRPSIYLDLGLCVIAEGQNSQGINTIQKGLDLAIKNNQKKIQLNIYAKLSELYLQQNNLAKALDCKQKENEIQKLMLLGGASIKMEQLQGIYEIEAKNKQIIDLQQENEINALAIKGHRQSILLMILGILVACLIIGIISYFFRRINQKNKLLNEANAAKDKFFAIIAHDLRGPTNSLTSLLEILNKQFDEFSRQELKEFLEMLHKSSENVSLLLENLLIWARSQVNKLECCPEKLQLDAALQSSLEPLQQLADKKQITISLNTDSSLNVYADSNMLQTAIRNVVSNAIKFTPRTGTIRITTELGEENTALIRISDNGVGIEEDNLSKIFDISNFHHTKGTEDEKSSGLGLIMVKDFVKKNKGTVNIESEINKGTTVNISLPIEER